MSSIDKFLLLFSSETVCCLPAWHHHWDTDGAECHWGDDAQSWWNWRQTVHLLTSSATKHTSQEAGWTILQTGGECKNDFTLVMYNKRLCHFMPSVKLGWTVKFLTKGFFDIIFFIYSTCSTWLTTCTVEWYYIAYILYFTVACPLTCPSLACGGHPAGVYGGWFSVQSGDGAQWPGGVCQRNCLIHAWYGVVLPGGAGGISRCQGPGVRTSGRQKPDIKVV